MPIVNRYLLEDILNPIGGSADVDEEIERYRNFDSNDPVVVKQMIIEQIKPYFDSASDNYKAALKRSLSYFLTTSRVDYGAVFDSCLIAFEHPTDARKLFVWIWKVLFPGQNFELIDVKGFVESEDVDYLVSL